MRNYLICWMENGIKKWDMLKDADYQAFASALLENPDVDNHTIFIVPTGGFAEGIWLWPKTHKSQRVDFWNFFEDLGTVYEPQISEKHKKIAEEVQKTSSDDSKYGFISPEGKYFHCGLQGHAALADRICFGMVETNNSGRYLEEHGWLRIYKPLSHGQYSVYIGGQHVITSAQMRTLTDMGLDQTAGVAELLLKDRGLNKEVVQ